MKLRRVLLVVSLFIIITSIAITVLLSHQSQTMKQQAQTVPATNPYQLGPDPSLSSVTATNGPFATEQITVPGNGNGFKTAFIYYPTDTTHTYGAVAIAPGTTAIFKDQEAWMGPRLASFGFVVIGIDTSTTTIPYTQRATELLAALDYLTTNSTVKDRVDPNRLATMGHSSGGGGALVAGIQRPSLKAAVGLAPWKPDGDLAELTVPVLILGGENDDTVTPSKLDSHWNSLPPTTPAIYIQVAGGDHVFSGTPNDVVMRTVIPWLKIFLDNDTRYTQFLCPLADDSGISLYKERCALVPSIGTTTIPTSTPIVFISPTYGLVGDCNTNNTCPTVTKPQPTNGEPQSPTQNPLITKPQLTNGQQQPPPQNPPGQGKQRENRGLAALLFQLLQALFNLILLLFSRQ